MINWFKNLSATWKVVVLAATLLAMVFIYDSFTGGLSLVRGWAFDKQSAVREKQVNDLLKEREALIAEKKEYVRQAVEAKAKEAFFEERGKALDAKSKAELDKLNQALEQQAKEEEITSLPTDAFTRCERTKAKMIALNIKSAQEINCNE